MGWGVYCPTPWPLLVTFVRSSKKACISCIDGNALSPATPCISTSLNISAILVKDWIELYGTFMRLGKFGRANGGESYNAAFATNAVVEMRLFILLSLS
jgi:hypothetical protein